MKNISRISVFTIAIEVVLLLLAALAVTQTAKFFLPGTTVHHQSHDTFVARHLYRFNNAFFEKPKAPTPEEQQVIAQQQAQERVYASLQTWKLKALYKKGPDGFIVVEVKGSVEYLNLGDEHEGYRLKDIIEKTAILERESQEYKLEFEEQTQTPKITRSAPKLSNATKKKVTKAQSSIDFVELSEGLVRRDDIEEYMSNTDKIWNNIKIRPYKVEGKIQGFMVRFVRKGSVFDALGLKNGDIIIEANGVKMTSLKNAEQLYKHVDEIDNVSIIVTRNGTQKELQYEIK